LWGGEINVGFRSPVTKKERTLSTKGKKNLGRLSKGDRWLIAKKSRHPKEQKLGPVAQGEKDKGHHSEGIRRGEG